MKARTKSRIIRSNLFVVRLERQELFRASNCWRLSEARKTGNQSCRCSIATAGGLPDGGGKRSSGGRNAVDEVADRDGEKGEKSMRNRPVKLNPKLTVLLYVLTTRGGLDRIARHRCSSCPLPLCVISPSPVTPIVIPVTRWRWNGRRGFDKRGTSASTSAETICELQQKAAVPNYFRPQATTVDNLITMAIPAATWPFSTAYIRTRCRTITCRPMHENEVWPFRCQSPFELRQRMP